MYQPIEVTSARTVWIDSPSEERLGFYGSSRVQIDRDPTGLTDWKEPGDPYRATLMSGMWPDDDELRLLVVGVVPGSSDAEYYLRELHPDDVKAPKGQLTGNLRKDATTHLKYHTNAGMDVLRELVQIMPAWSGQTQRSIFVRLGTPCGTPQTVVTESQQEPDRRLTFDMWRIQVDAMLIARDQKPTDQWEKIQLTGLSLAFQAKLTPNEFVDSIMEKPDGRDDKENQGSPA